MGRIATLAEKYLTADETLKAAPGEVHHVVFAWSGGAAGQYVIFRDGVDNTAPAEFVLMLTAATGNIDIVFPQGKAFGTGITVDFQTTATERHLAVTYK